MHPSMMSVGDSMFNQEGWLDSIMDVASLAAMATSAVFGNTMINKTGRIETNRTVYLPYTSVMHTMQQKQCH
jgi:hypothetical protein